ncbi:D-2-hydroxyacid dehydrogenase [Aneurinibacillus migulanus]|uniref:Phosphoglycerate dehydrogenase n=1 Tax=Aneurinibacillus migulanus TaxID=47500 RepID=A0A1G8J1A3_ANEMI|nr:D-2-hydroxyacid dehydrogenase [Aneurinibacillus migulanus]MED0892236.1 D-2-hydroxyacid dehydrogenase [Aneurinibacillus migulanus]MED1615812.1 D-2-hydroxyacid dehydrogenase [Aneurinibacillus migulanus]GED12342.1 3-phosphoglycerate dehydrogenase [Aneurinibacillus migulanus]SDI25014.1 Phosphoglycerate dehydrogenase [Aneurinibacillus migulanus]
MLVISITDELQPHHIERISNLVSPMEVVIEKDLYQPEIPIENAEILITYGHQVTGETLNRMPGLKWIQIFQSGVERLPFEEITKREILLTNIRDFHGIPMAEYVISMILYFTRCIPRYIQYQKERHWCRQEYVDEAYGKTLSIFGAGAIGQYIAQRCRQFGMRILGVNTTGKPHPDFDAMFSMKEKTEVLKRSDFVVLLLPATEETYHCFGKKEFAAMKQTACLINIGRGALINTDDLLASLDSREIRGAALDVTEEEPLPANHPLWDSEHVILTPHIAARTYQYFNRAIDKFALNWEMYSKGEQPPYYVDVKKEY